MHHVHPGSYFRELRNSVIRKGDPGSVIFSTLDPGSGMEYSDQASGINIPDPQHQVFVWLVLYRTRVHPLINVNLLMDNSFCFIRYWSVFVCIWIFCYLVSIYFIRSDWTARNLLLGYLRRVSWVTTSFLWPGDRIQRAGTRKQPALFW